MTFTAEVCPQRIEYILSYLNSIKFKQFRTSLNTRALISQRLDTIFAFTLLYGKDYETIQEFPITLKFTTISFLSLFQLKVLVDFSMFPFYHNKISFLFSLICFLFLIYDVSFHTLFSLSMRAVVSANGPLVCNYHRLPR